MPKGTWIREQTNERTAHRVPRLRGPTAGSTRVTWAFMVQSHVAHTTRHVSWVSDRALPDDARCIRPPFPRSSIRAAQPAIWSETWYGPGTRLANRWSGCNSLRGGGSCQSSNPGAPIGIKIGYLDPLPLWGPAWLSCGKLPGFNCFAVGPSPKAAPYTHMSASVDAALS